MNTTCPVCATEVPPYHYDHPNGARVQCPVCGTYRIMERAHRYLHENTVVVRNVIQPNRRLSGALRQRVEHGEEPVLSDVVAMEREYQPAADLPEVIDRILQHIRSKAPAGNKFVPLIGHRDYAVGGAEDPEAFDYALGQAMRLGYVQRQAHNEAAYRLTLTGWSYLRTIPAAPERVKRTPEIVKTSPEDGSEVEGLSSALGATALARDQVFISYSHKDALWLEKLQTMLKPLVRAKLISTWSDTQIRAGDHWYEDIQRALSVAKVAVLLVTPDFLASDFIAQHELPPLLEAAANEGLRIIWIPVRASMYKFTEIQRYQAAMDPTEPLSSLPEWKQEAKLVTICEEIAKASSH